MCISAPFSSHTESSDVYSSIGSCILIVNSFSFNSMYVWVIVCISLVIFKMELYAVAFSVSVANAGGVAKKVFAASSSRTHVPKIR